MRALLVDLDDTLIDTRAAFRAAIGEVLDGWLSHLGAQDRERATLHWATDPLGHYRAYTRGELDFVTQRRLRATDLHRRFGGADLDDEAFTRWQRGFDAAFQGAWALCPDALGLLDAVAAAGLAVGAVTNAARAYQTAKLAALDLTDRVPLLVAVDDLGFGKPDPRVFALACERAGVVAAEAAYVGDELDVDARAARDAGLLGVWLDRHGTGEQPGDVPVVRSLAELPAVLGLTVAPAARVGGRSSRRGSQGSGQSPTTASANPS